MHVHPRPLGPVRTGLGFRRPCRTPPERRVATRRSRIPCTPPECVRAWDSGGLAHTPPVCRVATRRSEIHVHPLSHVHPPYPGPRASTRASRPGIPAGLHEHPRAPGSYPALDFSAAADFWDGGEAGGDTGLVVEVREIGASNDDRCSFLLFERRVATRRLTCLPPPISQATVGSAATRFPPSRFTGPGRPTTKKFWF